MDLSLSNLKPYKGTIFIISITIIILIAVIVQLRYLGLVASKMNLIVFLINLCIYTLFFFVFIIVRNLYKIYGEGRHKQSYSTFEKRLVTAFVGFIIGPSLVLFILSSLLIIYTINKWFSLEFQKPIKNSMKVAKVFYDREQEQALKYVRIQALVHKSRYQIKIGKILEKNTYLNNHSKLYVISESNGSQAVDKAFQGIPSTEVFSTENGDTILAAAPIINSKGKISAVAVVETLLSRSLMDKIESFMNAYKDYSQLEDLQIPIKTLYFLVLFMATLLIVSLSMWISVRIAQGITVPIKSLADATEELAHGNMDINIQMERDDELGILIKSFNSMVAELKKGKLSLERAYKESDRDRLRMEAILENINTGVIFLTNNGTIRTINNSACSIMSVDRKNMTGVDYTYLIEKIESTELHRMIKRISEKSFKYIEREIRAYIRGKIINVTVHIMALKDSQGLPMGILVVFDDITEIIKAQRALAWQEVARRIAHEIKNPLTPIKLSAERLIKKWNENSPDFDKVFSRASKTIIKEVDSLKTLVDEFSRFGKMPSLKIETGSVNDLIEEVLTLYNDYKKVTFSSKLSDIPLIEFDRLQIKRVLINMIDNALNAHTRTITITTSYNSQMDLVSIEIIDDGLGIKKEDRDKLFLPYFSTKRGGTGLGLAIANKVISEHRGYIRVKENSPHGTIFIIELPVKR
jgi:two-component system nitrogen regulation sensor histidine kinase NtrY